MRMTFVISIAAGLLIGLVCSAWVPPMARSQETKPAANDGADKDVDDLQASAEAFEKAFNKGDAEAIAGQFIEKAQVVDEDENVVEGRDKIQARFTEIFKAYPKAKIAVEVTSLRKLSPDVAVEEGFSSTTLNPDEPASRSPYTLIHLKREGKWLIASVRDFPEEGAETAHSQLQSLEWLLGEWVDQSADSVVETSCQWADDGNYLMQKYAVKLRGGAEMHGTQRIGWDPVRHTIRGWAFDHSGGYGESTWTPVGDGWIIKAEGYAPDGRIASVTRTLTRLGPDLYQLDSTQRLLGQELLPDSSVRVARRPPAPAASPRRI